MTYALLAFAVVALGAVIGFAAKANALAGQVAEQRARADRAELERDQAKAALDQSQTTITRQNAAHEAELAQLRAQLATAEASLVQAHDPAAAGDFARRVLSGQTDSPADGPAGTGLPHGTATS